MTGPEEFLKEWNNDKSYVVAHTSGSTGVPKEIHLSKKLMTESALRTIKFFGLDVGSRFHVPLSFEYIAAKMMAVRTVLCEGYLTWEIPSNRILTEETDSTIDLLAVVPSQLDDFLNRKEKPHIRNMIVGGSSIPITLRERLCVSGINAYETYGMTETASHIALRKVTNDRNAPFEALDGIKISVNGNDCLCIEMENGMSFVTNDIAEIVDSKHFILSGRADNVIISGGLKVHPMVVERKIEMLLQDYAPTLPEFYISSCRHEKWGEQVVLVLEESDTSELIKVNLEKLKNDCRTILSPAEIPSKVIIEKKFERTLSGKIKRRKF